MMATTRFAVLWLCAACLGGMIFAAVGCAPSGGDALLPAPKTMIADIPVPTSFELEELRSRFFDNGEFRHIDLLYEGSGGMEDISRFYKNQMPITRWEPQARRM
ncbi:MAG: hypothetical protein KAR11_06215, partial [Phycisphaerae bacterium]|nr:hypothetical protein [Phycisphaerae bacterium]